MYHKRAFDISKVSVIKDLGTISETESSRIKCSLQTYNGGEPYILLLAEWKYASEPVEAFKVSKGLKIPQIDVDVLIAALEQIA